MKNVTTTIHEVTRSQKIAVMSGAMLALLLAALDQTIVGTAMPRIVQDLNGLEHLSWVFTAYLLTSTIGIPLIGKLSDIYGRKWFFILGITVFIIGSALSGFSQNMLQLILFRGVQGLGAGAIMANSFAAIGDLFPPAQRSRWQGLFGAVFGLSSVLGPTLGGYITDNFTWRWTFFINIPIGVIALVVIYLFMPRIVTLAKKMAIDWLGAGYLTLFLIPFLLGLVWGGTQYDWVSWQEIALFIISGLALIGFILSERRAEDPILPLHLFKSNIFSISAIVVFLTGLAMFGAIIYVPLYAQTVIGVSATNSGLIITPMTFGIVLSSVITGQVVSRTGRYKWLAVAGLTMVTTALYLLSLMTTQSSYFELTWKMILMGIGMGITFPIFAVVVQNAFEHKYLGVVTASTQLFRSLGGTVGVAIMGSVLNNTLKSKLGDLSNDSFVQFASKYNPSFDLAHLDINKLQGFLSQQVQNSINTQISTIPEPLRSQALAAFNMFLTHIKDALNASVTEVFLIASIMVALSVVAALFLKEIPLRESHEFESLDKSGEEFVAARGQAEAKDEPVLIK